VNRTVLVATHSGDEVCAPAVIGALGRRGARAVRFDTDRFPGEIRLASAGGGAPSTGRLQGGGADVDLAEVDAVWHRRLAFGRRLPASLDPTMREACVREARAAAMGTIAALDAFHLDAEHRIRRAEHKPLQLRAALAAGFEVPRTLITNDAAAASEFIAGCAGGAVCKMLTSFAIREDGREQVVFTTPITRAAVGDLKGLEWSPMVFQERVPKSIELRVTVVGGRAMAASMDPAAVAGAGDDWRRRGAELSEAWRAYELPGNVARRAVELVRSFALHYSAMDLILTPDGRWVFLESNPAGEYFWLDSLFEPSISDALADLLVHGPRTAA
jgi:glutathione synthase/RimK-type ligase-like ATP-grasp enzyme